MIICHNYKNTNTVSYIKLKYNIEKQTNKIFFLVGALNHNSKPTDPQKPVSLLTLKNLMKNRLHVFALFVSKLFNILSDNNSPRVTNHYNSYPKPQKYAR